MRPPKLPKSPRRGHAHNGRPNLCRTGSDGRRSQTKPSETWPIAVSASVHSSDNTNVPFARIAERLQRLLIGGSIVGGDSLFDGIELRYPGALGNPLFIGLHSFAALKRGAPIG